ncbi:MAG TPA: hypothetical protein VMH02_03285 [Verrucomicrobiae bacterium]|nr:hypothetical protein [Verrucomicrobiae bacterium]
MRKISLMLTLLVALAGCSSSIPSVAPTSASASCASAGPSVVYLTPSDVADPGGRAALQARAAFLAHSPVVLCGGEIEQLAKVLHLDDPGTFAAAEAVTEQRLSVPVKGGGKKGPPPSASPPPVATPEPSTPVPLEAVGYFLSRDGVVESFSGFIADPIAERDGVAAWVSEVTSAGESPSIGSWHQMFTNTERYIDDRGNVAQVTFNYWRLNNFNTKYDWYMETVREQGTPKWDGCEFDWFLKDNGFIGWRNTDRTVRMTPQDNSNVVLYEHAPKTTESTGTASFSIGASLDIAASGPGGSVNAQYSQSWSQSDVTIRDETRVPNAEQIVSFTAPNLNALTSPTGCPPQTSKTAFDTPHASIFQVPQGQSLRVWSPTKLTFTMWNPVKGEIVRFRVDARKADIAFSPTYTFVPSVFEVSPKSVRLSQAHPKATIHIEARSGDSNLGWYITNQPEWVVLSQAHGLGNKDVTIEAQAKAPRGSIANLNFDTDPRGGANSVETGPIILRAEKE